MLVNVCKHVSSWTFVCIYTYTYMCVCVYIIGFTCVCVMVNECICIKVIINVCIIMFCFYYNYHGNHYTHQIHVGVTSFTEWPMDVQKHIQLSSLPLSDRRTCNTFKKKHSPTNGQRWRIDLMQRRVSRYCDNANSLVLRFNYPFIWYRLTLHANAWCFFLCPR